ncbi:hypothetical protein CsatB_009946 [Cannabis sativa]
MENENLEEWQRLHYFSKELSRLYEACYEEKKKVQDIGKENAKLRQRIEEMESEHKMKQNESRAQLEAKVNEMEKALAESEESKMHAESQVTSLIMIGIEQKQLIAKLKDENLKLIKRRSL